MNNNVNVNMNNMNNNKQQTTTSSNNNNNNNGSLHTDVRDSQGLELFSIPSTSNFSQFPQPVLAAGKWG